MCKIIIVANQKGGVAKTSTVRNLAYSLSELGKTVLAVDFDPQHNLTTSFGVMQKQINHTSGSLITRMLEETELPEKEDYIHHIGMVDLILSDRTLAVTEVNLQTTPGCNDYLALLLEPLRSFYDYILVDTNPALGSLTINALTAADEVMIPIDPELFAITGLYALIDTVKRIKRKLNPNIEIGGILFTKCNRRTLLYARTYREVHERFCNVPIYSSQIPTTVKVGDANSYGMSVVELDRGNPASIAYMELAREVIAGE